MKKTAEKPKDVISKVFDEAGGMLVLLIAVKYLEIVIRYITFNIHQCHMVVLAQVGSLILYLNCFNNAKWILCQEAESSSDLSTLKLVQAVSLPLMPSCRM